MFNFNQQDKELTDMTREKINKLKNLIGYIHDNINIIHNDSLIKNGQ